MECRIKVFLFLLICIQYNYLKGQTLVDNFADGDFTASPVWAGDAANWTIAASSDVAAGAASSNTVRLSAPAVAQTEYLSTQIANWGTEQEWGFFVGRRGQGYTLANQVGIWLYANESDLESATVDGYRLLIGDDASNDDIFLQSVTNGTGTTILTSSGALTNAITDVGFLVRVTRSSAGVFTMFTSTLPTASGAGAIASDIPNSTNATVNQGNVTNTAYTPAANGYLGFTAKHSTGASAIAAVEIDMVYMTPSTCADPTTQATAFDSSNIASTTATVSWTRGNGDNVLVVARSGGAVDADPSDGTAYTANAAFGSGTQIGTGNYVVYSGTGTSVNITGLTAGTAYYFALYEFSNPSCYFETELTGNFISASAASDAVAVAASETDSISSLINTAGPLTSTGGVQVWQFTVRDGGSGLNDADVLPTIVTRVVINQAGGNTTNNWSDGILSVDLFDGATQIDQGTVTSTLITFSGFSSSVADGTAKTYSVRLSLKCGVGSTGNNDGDDFVFKLNPDSLTFASTGSSAKSGWSFITSTNGKNVLKIEATNLAFTTQPTSTAQNISMSPSVVVKGVDACLNQDLNFTGTISIVSTGTLTGTPVSVAAASGAASFSTLTHTALGTGLELSASSGSLTSATSTFFDITSATVFVKGDLAIVGVNANNFSCSGNTGEDEISFVTFKDIAVNTTIDLTDNGYERCNAGQFGNTEGAVRATRTTSTLPAGTLITFRCDDAGNFTAIDPDANWTFTDLTTGDNFNLNSGGDQVFIMQGGTWNQGTGTDHNATYTGGIVSFGFSTNPSPNWTASCSTDPTQRSNAYPSMECFSMAPTGTSDFNKYTGLLTATSKKDWIRRLSNSSNWTSYATCALYNAASPNYITDDTITITSTGMTTGRWTGESSTDWYNCNNWDDLEVPDSNTNVSVLNQTNDPLIAASPAAFPTGAFCNNITIDNASGGGVLTMNNALSELVIKGDLTNNGTLTTSNGKITLRGSVAQIISGVGDFNFYNCIINNSHASGVTLSSHIGVNNILTLTNGKLDLGSKILTLTNPAITAVARTSGWIHSEDTDNSSKVKWYMGSTTGSHVFHFGKGSGAANYLPFTLNLTAGTIDTVTLATYYTLNNATLPSSPDVVTELKSAGVENEDNVVDRFWQITKTGASGTSTITFSYADNEWDASEPTDYEAQRWNVALPGWDPAIAGQTQNTAANSVTVPGVTNYSPWTLSRRVFPLPVKLLWFNAKPEDERVKLDWSTASEINNDYFVVQRKGETEELFSDILTKRGSGNSNSTLNYSSIDPFPLKGLSYYQLIQKDFDGNSTKSNIVAVNFIGNSILKLIPDKSSGEIKFKLKGGNDFQEIEIMDVLGKTVFHDQINRDDEVITGKINFTGQPNGIYFFRFISGDGSQTIKFGW